MQKKCEECGKDISGRADKKFCSDYCRNLYNNSRNKDTKNLIRNTHNRLRKNHRILTKLNLHDKTKTTKEKLLQMDFSFDLFTSIYTTKAGATYYYVYDQGYLPLENNYYLLVKRDIKD